MSSLNEAVVKNIAEKHSVTPAQVRWLPSLNSGYAVCRIRNQCRAELDPDLNGSALFLMGWIRNQEGDPLQEEKSVEMFYFELLDFSLLKPLGYIVTVLKHKK